MKTNWKISMHHRFIHQYTIVIFIVNVAFGVSKLTFKCPNPTQWKFRSKSICNDSEKYICLFDENGQMDAEFCGSWPDFENPGYKQILLGGTTRKPCSEYRYQPFTFWTNGSSKCVYKKTSCSREGQVIYNNGTALSDRTCRCDYTNNYDFLVKPRNNCFCVPTVEDCSCYVKPCPVGSLLTPDYKCLAASKWKLSFFSCSEINKDSIDDKKKEMSTIISKYGYETSSDSVVRPTVYATVICIAAVCVLVLTYLLIKHKDEFETKHVLKGKADFKRKETTHIPVEVFGLQEKAITTWRKRQENFEITEAYKQVLNTMKTNGFVILSGPPGSGKSAIAYNTAFMLEQNEKYQILSVLFPEEIRKYLLPETKQVFIIDDPVGKYSVDDLCIQRWKNEETFINQTFTDLSNTRLILTCRSYIYKSGFSLKLNVSPIHFDLLLYSLKLSHIEREKMCKRYNVPELKEETLMMYNFFPVLCALYKTQEDTAMFFVNPYKILTEEIRNIKEKSDIAFLAVALLVIQDNDIDRQILSLENQTTKELLNDICNECGFKYFPSTTVILETLNHLIGTYVQETDVGFACIHDTLFQNFSFIVGSSIIHCLLKYGNCTFIANRLQLASIQQKHHELVIMVKQEQEDIYFQRLVLDIRKGHHSHVFTGMQMQFSQFRTKLLTFLESLKAEDLTCDQNNSTPLHVVSENGYEDLVFKLFQLRKEHINLQDKNKRTPLFMACLGCHNKVIQTLLALDNSSLHVANNEDLTPFDIASINDDVSTLTILHRYGAKVNRKDEKINRTALQRACDNGSYNAVTFLLTKNANVKHKDSNGLKAIHIACSKGHLKIVELLLNHDKNMINECDTTGKTPLFTSCESNQQNIACMLLKKTANVNTTSVKGMAPLHKACKIGNDNIVALLLDYSAKVNVQSENGLSPLHIACSNGEVKIVKLLLNKNADIHLMTKQGMTPFFISCSKGYLEICEVLHIKSANINLHDKSLYTPLHVACREKHEKIVRFLVEHNADINALNTKRETSLYIACVKESFDIVELLLNYNADVNMCNEEGNSPLHAACIKENKKIVQLLLDKKADTHKQNKAGKTPCDVVHHLKGREANSIVEMFNQYKAKQWQE